MLFCILLYDVTNRAGKCASGIGFVGIDVHSECEGVADADNGVTEYGGSAVGIYLNRNDLFVADAERFCIGRGHVNVSFGNDHAFGEFNRCAVEGVNELNAGRACGIAAFANGGGNAEGSRIGERYFYLACRTSGTEDRNAGMVFLGPTTSRRSAQAN